MDSKSSLNENKNSKIPSSVEKGIPDLVNILNDDQVEEIIQSEAIESPQIFEDLRCYLEHLQSPDTHHVARFIANFCFSDAANQMDPSFFMSAVKALIFSIQFYPNTNIYDFQDHDFYVGLLEFLQNDRYRTFSLMILKALLGKIPNNSIDFLSEEEIDSFYQIIIQISNDSIAQQTDKTKINDLTCFLPLSFTLCLEEIPQSLITDEFSSILEENLKLCLNSQLSSIINLGLYCLFFIHEIIPFEFKVSTYRDNPKRNEILPNLLRLCTVLPSESFVDNDYPFSFDEIIELSLNFLSPLWKQAQTCFSIFYGNDLFSEEQDLQFLNTAIDLISSGNEEISFDFKQQCVLTLSAFEPSLLIKRPEFLELFYSVVFHESNDSDKFILAAILKAVLYAQSCKNSSFLSAFAESTNQYIEELISLSGSVSSSESILELSNELVNQFNLLVDD